MTYYNGAQISGVLASLNIESDDVLKGIIEQNNGVVLSFWVGTQAEYDVIEHKLDNCFYLVTDDPAMTDIQNAIQVLQDKVAKVDVARPIKDYVIDYGSYHPRLYDANGKDINENGPTYSSAWWTYTRWESGRISIDGGISISADKGRSDFGSGYVTAYSHGYGYPEDIPLVSEPHVTIGLGNCSDNGFFWPVVRQWAKNLKTQTPLYAVCSSSSYAHDGTGNYHICVHVEGRWK